MVLGTNGKKNSADIPFYVAGTKLEIVAIFQYLRCILKSDLNDSDDILNSFLLLIEILGFHTINFTSSILKYCTLCFYPFVHIFMEPSCGFRDQIVRRLLIKLQYRIIVHRKIS